MLMKKKSLVYNELWKYVNKAVYLFACGIYVKIKVYMHDK